MSVSVKGYHSHIYFDEHTVEQARSLAEKAGQAFDLSVGRIIEKPIGPHPTWSCQLAYKADLLNEVLPWLAIHRGDLTIFSHIVSGDDLWDHTQGTIWMGKVEALNLAMFTS